MLRDYNSSTIKTLTFVCTISIIFSFCYSPVTSAIGAATNTSGTINVLNSQGLKLLNSGKANQSISYFDKALAINPNNFFALYNKGAVLVDLTKFNESLPYLDKALAINPNDVNALTSKGLALVFLKKPNQSISYFDKALAINPNDVNSLTSKGLALAKSGDYNESISYFDKALAINPKFDVAIQHKQEFVAARAAAANATALTNRGIALLSLGEYTESLPYFNKALSISTAMQPVLEPVNTFALAGKKLDLAALSETSAPAISSTSTFGYYFGSRTTNATPTLSHAPLTRPH
jgi:tetratricopeptide (TPR) repeat protein